jgi:hypothetical protein
MIYSMRDFGAPATLPSIRRDRQREPCSQQQQQRGLGYQDDT